MTNVRAPTQSRLEAVGLECASPLSPPHPAFPHRLRELLAACPGHSLTPRLPSAVAFLSQERFSGHLIHFLFVPCLGAGTGGGGGEEEGNPFSDVGDKGRGPGPSPLPGCSRPHCLMPDPHWLQAMVSKLQVTRYVTSVGYGQN